MQERFGHRYLVESWGGAEVRDALAEILALPLEAFDRPENPFERKWLLKDKFTLPAALDTVVTNLELETARVGQIFNVRLERDTSRYYCGIFKYDAGDWLAVHVDAGIHPLEGTRKHVTAVLYLNETRGGALEFWNGQSASFTKPMIFEPVVAINPEQGKLVLFENNDSAWHGLAAYSGAEPRVVVTVSYLSEEIERFANKRERAYFVPRPNDNWSPEVYRARDERATFTPVAAHM